MSTRRVRNISSTPVVIFDEDGNTGAEVSIKGSNVADGTAVSAMSFVEDPAGFYALRVVDAAPFLVDLSAYATPTHTAVNVTTASTQLLAANADRKYALFVNDSDTPLYLAFGTAAVAASGVLLLGQGSSYEMTALQGNLYRGVINAIHAGTGNKVALVTQGV